MRRGFHELGTRNSERGIPEAKIRVTSSDNSEFRVPSSEFKEIEFSAGCQNEARSMGYLLAALGFVLIVLVLWDALETIILPRTVARRIGLSSFFNKLLRKSYKLIGRCMSTNNPKREQLLGAFGPMSLLFLIGVWAWLMIFGFAFISAGLQLPLAGSDSDSLPVHIYASAVTFFTVGYGDITAVTGLGRTVSVFEAGMGFGFLALVIGYIPVLYGSFSRREATILLLDARAGSPPTAGELLRRYDAHGIDALTDLLKELERWSANLLESYLSYPSLALYRSQHEKMSWLGALTMIMDACSLLQVGCEKDIPEHNALMRQAELSYALARHVVVDLAYILDIPPRVAKEDRLPPSEWTRLITNLKGKGLMVANANDAYVKLLALRKEYEPYINGVSDALFLPLPPWLPMDGELDSWEVTAWDEGRHF
jgi:hypothetical protein